MPALALALSNSHLTPLELDFLNLTMKTANVVNLQEPYNLGHIRGLGVLRLPCCRGMESNKCGGSQEMAQAQALDV